MNMHDNFEQLKNKYYEGYRCIYKEKDKEYTLHLKNFERGKICTISSNDTMEIGEIENFLDQLDQLQKRSGYDCICTGHECD